MKKINLQDLIKFIENQLRKDTGDCPIVKEIMRMYIELLVMSEKINYSFDKFIYFVFNLLNNNKIEGEEYKKAKELLTEYFNLIRELKDKIEMRKNQKFLDELYSPNFSEYRINLN